MKKFLVTGATGFVGSNVVQHLLNNGHYVIATSTNKAKASSFQWFSQVEYIEFNLHSFDESKNYFDFFQTPDILIHLAWQGLPNYTEEFHIKKNLPQHLAFLQNLIFNGLTDITVTGTCLEYGMTEGCLSEDMICEPTNAYAIAKDELRKALEALSSRKGISFKWVRLFYMYGKGQNPKSLISQLDEALENNEQVFNMSGGEQVRDFLPIGKMAEYLVLIASQNKINGIINCCSGVPVKLKDFVKSYLRANNKNINLNLGYYDYTSYEPMNFWGDTRRLDAAIEIK